MPDKITGSCNCGRHVYTIPMPTEMNLCHCMDCKKWAGAMHSAHMFVKTETSETSSPTPKLHTMNAESGNPMERAWCDECGCGIWLKATKSPETTYFKAGLFEHGEIPQPTMENWMKNMEKWEQPALGTKRQAYDGN
ncbi:hypothetical protein CB0940_08168 [Cercospora beticola]|uniref:CENP-V/GFA domain-containing protein n=1 Tax=Cercospora beticola TaxID=122368 RepID=A0A2G5HPY9_CERBT|nr:hypothetical protein CB0940_08168 [Cercospora beticola]PIA94599.1 hypothetical protein CB0940_08168 [Cercospora beticola]WPB04735.1 hypothetical protein RHO25_009382 [Cercospora beticola]